MALCGSGCGQPARKAPEGLIAVSGVVTLDDKPADHVAINFLPQAGTSGMGGYAVTDPDGHFQVLHLSNANHAEGLEPGSYHVTFSRIAMPDGSPIPAGKDAADVGAVESLPPHLAPTDPATSRYSLTVESAKSDVKFDLHSKP